MPYAQRKLSFDDTHLGQRGAAFFAAMVARELPKVVPATRPLLYEAPPPAH